MKCLICEEKSVGSVRDSHYCEEHFDAMTKAEAQNGVVPKREPKPEPEPEPVRRKFVRLKTKRVYYNKHGNIK